MATALFVMHAKGMRPFFMPYKAVDCVNYARDR